MKEYTTIIICPDKITGTCLYYTESMERLNSMAKQGWEVDNMVNVEGNKGEYLVLLSRNVSQNVQMLND